MVVVVLTDAGLATSQQPFPRPQFSETWLAPPIDQSPVPAGAKPYDWDETTGLARRFVPGQPNGMHTLTGLAHDRLSHVAYDPDINEEGLRMRSLKLAALQKTLKAPPVFGKESGDLLVIGWGSTKGAIEEAVETLQRRRASRCRRCTCGSCSRCRPASRKSMQRFKQVMTIESNWSDDPQDEIIDETNRRYSALAMLLRARYLVDVDCWTEVRGQPIKPGTMCRVIREKLQPQEAQGDQIMNTATECLLRMCEEHHELEDYQSGVPRWCTGCGDNAILTAVQRLCRDENLRPEKTVFVSGIGCSSRFPHYMRTYGFHGIHGRALPIAEGVKMARPDLNVFVNTGDGDCCSIGAAHWIHAMRYNMNMTVLLHDNQIYGLTKKQASPTSPIGTKSNTTPRGSLPRGAQSAHRDARRAERVVRRAGRRLDPGGAVRHGEGRLPPQGLLVRAHHPALPGMAAEAVRPVAARPEPHAHAAPRARPAAQRRAGQGLQEPAGARSVEHPPRARNRQRHRSDPGRHPLPQPGGALLRGNPARGTAAHRRARRRPGSKRNSTSTRSGRRTRAAA